MKVQLLAASFLACAMTASYALTLDPNITKLIADDGTPTDFFSRVAISEEHVAVGAFLSDPSGRDSGSAYVFDRSTTHQISKLVPSDGEEGDLFGFSLAIEGRLLLVGAYDADEAAVNDGSAYLFDLTTGDQIAKLLPSDRPRGSGRHFGQSVAMENGYALIGAPSDSPLGRPNGAGAAYLFDTTSGTEISKITLPEGDHLEQFGRSVAIDDRIAVIGAIRRGPSGVDSGSAYIYNVAAQQLLFRLNPNDAADGQYFGESVDIDNGVAIVGANLGDGADVGSGAAYLFDVVTGEQIAKLWAPDGREGDSFGSSVAIYEGIAVVGASGHDSVDVNAGAVYLFDVANGQLLEKLTAFDAKAGSRFGASVAIDASGIAIGSLDGGINGDRGGSVYLYRIVPEPTAFASMAIALALALAAIRLDRQTR